MSIYEEKPEQAQQPKPKQEKPVGDYESLHNQIGTQLDYEDSVIFLTDEIESHTLTEFIIRMRSLLQNRKDKSAPVNLMINSPGGDIYEMFGIIDYIESLDVKVNTICRGRAMSAAALILASGTGKRLASKRSTVMLHEGSSVQVGKYSDLKVASKQADKMEGMVRDLLAEKTKKDANWWAENTKTDLWLNANEALDLGLIDDIG